MLLVGLSVHFLADTLHSSQPAAVSAGLSLLENAPALEDMDVIYLRLNNPWALKLAARPAERESALVSASFVAPPLTPPPTAA